MECLLVVAEDYELLDGIDNEEIKDCSPTGRWDWTGSDCGSGEDFKSSGRTDFS
jgi:hypothetical protein